MNKKSRRNILKGLAVGIPTSWAKPIVDSVVLPAHAMTSCFPFTDISCGQTISGTTTGGTTANAPENCGEPLDRAPGLWYRIIGTGCNITFETCSNTNFDSVIGVFSGNAPCRPSELVCEDGSDIDSCGEGDEQIIIATQDGVSYFVYVTGFDGGEGNFDLLVTCSICAEN